LQLPPNWIVAARNERESPATTTLPNDGTRNETAGYVDRHDAWCWTACYWQ